MTDDTKLPRGLSRYVPRLAAEWDLDAPGRRWRSLDASLCFVDISGFTNLSERLARRGRIGAEELTEVLNRVFGSMLELAYARGGVLLKFGGDALLLMFRGVDHPVQACNAAVEMRSALKEAAAVPTSVGRVPLRMSVGIHSGEVHLYCVGRSHRELVITGPAASLTAQMEHAAGPGEIVVSAATRAALPAGAADQPDGPGWRLRWRRPKEAPTGPVPSRPVAAESIAHFVPVALRPYLLEGAVEPEHRAATVAFVRFRGLEALMDRGGPEAAAVELDRLIGSIQDACDAEMVAFLATDLDEDGGKVVLAAGTPATQEDDEGRVLRTVRRIADVPTELDLHVGVNRGHVFSGAVGMPFRATYTAMGDTVNVAARLMAAAPPGEIYATQPVIERARTTFRTTALPPLHVKGKSAPLQALAVGAETGNRATSDAGALPLVGRQGELEELQALLVALGEGAGGAVLVEGGAGMGKTRLVAEALGDHPELTVSSVRGEPYGSAIPYRAVRDAVRQFLDVERAEPAIMAAQLLEHLEQLAPDLVPLAPLVAEVAHVPVPSTPLVDEIEPRFRRDRQADAIVGLVRARVKGPLVLVVDDAHWVDEASAHLLSQLVVATTPEGGGAPWLIIAARRPLDGGFEPDSDSVVTVAPLQRSDAEELVWSASGSVPLRPHEVHAIVSRAAGNPLYLQEALRLVAQTGDAGALPDSLDAVVGAEIDSLPARSRRILRCAAVLGRSFRDEALRLLLAGEGIEVDGALDEELGRFLEREGERWRFRQALVRDLAYEGLSYRRRRELHRRAGAATERLAGGRVDQVAELLARHYSASQDHELAWRYSRIAAERARVAYANVEAATHYEDALEALSKISDVPDREQAELWTRLGDVREQLGMYGAALEAYRRAARLVHDDPLASARVALRQGRAKEQRGAFVAALRGVRAAARRLEPASSAEAARWEARLTAFESVVRQGQEHTAEALAVAQRAIQLAKRSEERFALAQAYNVLDWALIMRGRAEEAVHASMALAIYEELGDLARQASALNNLGAAAYFEGRWDTALGFYERSRAAFRRSGNEVQASVVATNTGEILVNQGRLDEAEPLLREAWRVLRGAGSDLALFAQLQVGRLRMDQGDLEEAERMLTNAQQDAVAVGGADSALEVAIHLARCHVRRGDLAIALETLRSAQRSARAEAALFGAQVAEVETMILAGLDLWDEARAANAFGIEEARRQGLVYELALLVLAGADLEARAGGQVDQDAVAGAVAVLSELGCEARLTAQLVESSR